MIEIPAAYRQNILETFGDKGASWLAALPVTIDEYADRWSLTDLGNPFELSFNYVLPATRADGSEAVLKISVPDGEHRGELDALTLYNGEGVCQLLEADREGGAMLLERLRPGDMLAELADDAAATEIAAALLKNLWRPVPVGYTFPTVADWFQALARHRERFDGAGPLDEQIFATAEGMVRDLLAANEPAVLLHGDFHHFNILRAERAPWLIIDPKGLVGDPCYELGAFLYNPMDSLDPAQGMPALLRRRLDQFHALLGFERERIRHWGIAQSVLSAVWTCQGEGDGWRYTMGVAEMLLAS